MNTIKNYKVSLRPKDYSRIMQWSKDNNIQGGLGEAITEVLYRYILSDKEREEHILAIDPKDHARILQMCEELHIDGGLSGAIEYMCSERVLNTKNTRTKDKTLKKKKK